MSSDLCRSFFFVALLIGVNPCPAFSQAIATPAPQEIPTINATMQKFIDSGECSGIVTLVGHNGKVIHLGSVGLANIEQEKRMTVDSAFAIASMTKPIVATAVLMLQDDGKLNVDDKVSKYIPAFANMKLKNGDEAKREITIRDCITHTSGLAGRQIFETTLKDVVDQIATTPLAYQPGEKWQYSPGLNVAGRIIEIVSDQPLEAFLQHRIFHPLGMSQTTFFPNKQQIENTATLYEPSDEKGKLVPAVGFLGDLSKIKVPNPSGGLISTAGDMFRFYQMVLNRGTWKGNQIVSAAAVQQMTSRQTGELKTGFTPGNCWGLGWCIVREPQNVTGMLSAGTFGHGGAFGTQGWVDPKTETIYVLMLQRLKLPNSDGSDIRKDFQQIASEQLN